MAVDGQAYLRVRRWPVCTCFVASDETGSAGGYKAAVRSVDYGDIVGTSIYPGLPMHVHRPPYVDYYEGNQQAVTKVLTVVSLKGVIPNQLETVTFMMPVGNVAVLIHDILPAYTIVNGMAIEQAKILQDRNNMVSLR